MLLKAPAKINLTLRVLSKRADGYHEISSLMRAICLFDKVEIRLGAEQKSGSGAPPSIRIKTDMPGIPDGPENLAYRAAEAVLMSSDKGSLLRVSSIDILLEKHIPAAAGLAGGSADAAAVLLGLAKELTPGVSLADVAAIGAAIGADVPFCVYACAAANPGLGYQGAAAMRAEGVGEALMPVNETERADVLLVKPPVEISTKEVYALYDQWGKTFAASSDNDLEDLCAQNWPTVAQTLRTVQEICAEENAGKIRVQLSGSGPTVFAYFEDGHTAIADRAYARAKNVFPGMFVCLTETLQSVFPSQ